MGTAATATTMDKRRRLMEWLVCAWVGEDAAAAAEKLCERDDTPFRRLTPNEQSETLDIAMLCGLAFAPELRVE